MSKRYERMSKEEIVEFIEECDHQNCATCPAVQMAGNKKSCIARYLTAEVSMKKRWQLIQSDEDVKRMRREFSAFCKKSRLCEECELYDKCTEFEGECFDDFLCEEVEVPNE